ncbi:MAG: SusC/RagA family TonB-linked outer membrane protein [Bacteroidetes bacterium]|nr:MAG: SusC/RagA family TonB-linked outer membrane protein [Bacteroidota bacterium]
MKKLLLTLVLICVSTVFLFSQQTVTVSGQVIGNFDQPLEGATVRVADSGQGTVTDEEGRWLLKDVVLGAELYIDYLGYEQQQVNLDGSIHLLVVMKPVASGLEEVVVLGFGSEKRREITGAISSVGSEAFDNVPVPTFQRALQGRMPGVVVTNASGGLNAEANIRIRGTGSINAGNQPLIVVDGLILAAQPGVLLGFSTNPFLGIDPNSIKSVEVLKDASSTAIYGARGANGVILVTTKSGDFHADPEVTISSYAGFSEVTKKYDLLDGREFAAFWNTAAMNSGLSSGLLYNVATEPSVDWQSLLLRKGFVQETSAGVSGGTSSTRYYLGATFRSEDSYLNTIGLRRYNLIAKVEQKIGEKWRAGISLNVGLVNDKRTGNLFAGSAWGGAAWAVPNLDVLDKNGQYYYQEYATSNGYDYLGSITPYTMLNDIRVEANNTMVLAHSHLEWSPVRKLKFRTEFAAELAHELQNQRFGQYTYWGFGSGSGGAASRQTTNYNWTSMMRFEDNWSDVHKIISETGIHLTRDAYQGIYASGSGFYNLDQLYLNSAAQTSSSSWKTDAAFFGIFERISYSYKQKYFLNLSARYDGSSSFGKNNRFGFFPAISAGWMVSDEPFVQVEPLDHLKLRTSMGISGNGAIDNSASKSLVDFSHSYNGEPGYVISALENEDLTWEKSWQWDMGLDFSLWKGRLIGSMDYFIRITSDLLLERPVPATNGVDFIWENIGAIRNEGLEFELVSRIFTKTFKWNLALNGATLKNKVLELIDGDSDGIQEDIVIDRRIISPGYPVGSYYLVEYAGVDPSNGNALFYDLEGNQLVNDVSAANRKILENGIPRFSGGITSTFMYKNFDLTAFLHFKTGYSIYMADFNLETNMAWSDNVNRNQLNAWTPTNTNTDVPQARIFTGAVGVNGVFHSSRYLDKGDHLRLKNLNLGYTFQNLGRNNSSLRIYTAVQNLFLLTRFRGLDPDGEMHGTESPIQGTVRYNLPSARTYTFGFTLKM